MQAAKKVCGTSLHERGLESFQSSSIGLTKLEKSTKRSHLLPAHLRRDCVPFWCKSEAISAPQGIKALHHEKWSMMFDGKERFQSSLQKEDCFSLAL